MCSEVQSQEIHDSSHDTGSKEAIKRTTLDDVTQTLYFIQRCS